MRYFENTFTDYNGSINIDEPAVKSLIDSYVRKIAQNKNENSDNSLYVGNAGIAYMFLKLSQSTMKNEYPALEFAKVYADSAKSILKKSESKKYISFLSGNAGVYAVSAGVSNMYNRSDSEERNVNEFLKGLATFQNPQYLKDGADEFLVGRAGYLYGILWLNSTLSKQILPAETMLNLCTTVIESGRAYIESNRLPIPLMYQYHGREYLGAAHGICAILQITLSILSTMDNFSIDNPDVRDLKTTIDVILDLQNEGGNFPNKFDMPDAHLVHWCHGAPGVVYLYAKAYMIFKEQKYLDACLKCGDLVWNKGLLMKGPGICHGIAGNGYVLLLLYRLTQDPKHLYRASKFAEFLTNDKFLRQSRTPDRPFSLYEGIAGTICFLIDLIQPQKSAFPFMDIF
ncbi:unnamed protein product [Diamesa hyperborea]